MYSEDDDVAKIAGYVISVAKGVKYLGEKHLVRFHLKRLQQLRLTVTTQPLAARSPKKKKKNERENIFQPSIKSTYQVSSLQIITRSWRTIDL